ncbi:retention module-containing protein [Aeromonas caviae]|uniref:retention module-containing protein n=1 Tax=Aeromonas caviae TaxID=648 RepID=UPI00191D468D|nr:retention module-containing protein [Aeromonas caviae]MBL0547916.1 retention module-containing protein [Aeromonas caviae]
MAELRIDKPTLIAKVEGAVFVMDADGSLRRATPGMQLEPGMRLLTESDGQVELAEAGSERPEPTQPEAALPAGVDAELASLQEAIRQGADPTKLFEETAAGNAAAATVGGVAGSSAGGFVVVDRINDATLAEAGFDTGHEARQPGDELLYAEDQDLLAAITITEPQTDDNIINADEATGVIIRGFVEDVEVGQTVTVTLIDQDGNRLTTTTVVLPGFVWEANFGDVTGKLVDGPLTIQADTQDAAGNRASDTGQTLLDTITTITLDLADESDTGTSQTDDLTRDTTPLLQGKGEPGATVTLTLEGKVMAVLTVDGNGNWQYQIPDTLADGPHDFRVDAVDIAGNRASDTLTVTVDTRAAIDIDDLDTDSILGHDKVTLSGSTTDVEAGQRVTITLVGQNGQTLFSGSALVGSDGRWQLGGLDLSSIQGPYEVRAEVTDLAGNRVIDGAPLIGQSDVLTLSEADLAKGPVSATGSLHTGAGLDGNLQVSFAADQGALNQLGLTSHGTALAYQVSGQTFTASAGGVTVFTLTLANDGSYRIVWNQSLDHGQDSLSLPFALEYRDSDGDRVSANLTVNLVDSTPPDFTIAPISLTEDDFTNPAAVVGQSQFVVGHQSDPLVATSAVFADQSATLARLNGSGISSDGHALTFEFTGDRLLTGYYLDGNGKRVEVLKAELTASQHGSDIDGNVTVSLNGPLDHQGSDQLSLGLTVSAKEIDGDETRADLVVSISDGVDPRLGIDSGVTLQEGASGQTLDGQLPVSVGSDRLVSLNFEASQPGLNGLTSGGQPTHYQVNGNVITLLDAGGKTILTVTLGLDGKYQVALDGVLDQPVSTNSVNLGLQVQGTDFDGDKSNLGTLNIHITDGVLPQVDPISLTLVEDSDWSAAQTLTGDLAITAGADPLVNIAFDASQPGLQGLTSGGQLVVITISGNSISGAVNGQNVFTLTLDQNGHYVFTLNQPLDQGSADSLLKAGFTLTDSDGDKVSSTLSVAIGDGANPVISAVTGTEMTEANQGAKDVVSHMSFTVSHGADALDTSSLKFDIAAIQQSLDGKYSSHGSPVTFTLDANGELVGTSADGREVLRAELDLVESNGNWSVTAKVTLGAELDHQGSESLDLPLTVTLTDKDGDRVSTDLPLTIKDGHAPHFVAGSGVSLDERGLDGSNTLTGTGHFQVNAGSDRVSEVSFADISEQPALTALGQSVKYELVDGDASIPGNQVLKGYVEVNGQRVEVLQVELVGKLDNAASNGFDYKVTLFEGVHQSGGTATDLPFKLNIVDSDKGSGNNDSATGTLNIRISEGANPTLSLTGVTLSEGRFDGAANNQTGDDQHATGTLSITADSDPVVDVRLTLSGQVLDASGKAITHNGETLTWQEVPGSNGHGFQAVTASGTLVLTVTLPSVPGRIEAHTQATLDYQVTVHTNLDHGADDKLNLSLPVKVTDSDGSVITGSTTAVITDAADPHLGIDSGVTLQEGGASQSLDGQLPVNVGSDRLVSLNFEANQPGLNGLTSGGQPTHYQVNGNVITLLDAGGKSILTVTLGLDGKYQVVLDGVLDQPVSTNSVNLGLQVQGTDFDGDKSNLGTLNIHITDGVLPQVDPVSLTLVEDSDWSAAQTLTGDLAITAGADPLVNIAFDASQPGLQGLTSGGQPVVITISGNSISGAVNGQNVFTLTLDQNGHYIFTLNQPLDQGSADSLLKVGFTLTDSDGDKVSSTLSVAIGDGANPVISAVTGTEMTEANQGAKDVVSHMSFTVSHGADALDTSSLKFDIAAIQQSLDGKYSSHGSPVTFTLDANGELVGTSADGREVLRAELSLVENNGNWSVTAKVTLGAELDHQGSESLDLPLTVTLTDKDGDRVSTDLPLTIKDGHAPHFVAGSGVSLDERGLDGSNTLTGTGHFQVNAGSDRVSEVSFADISEQPALTALGQSVKYELVDGDASIPGNQVLKGYVEVNGQRVEVLQVELVGKLDNAASNGFDYKVTLYQGVHQSGGNATDLPFKLNIVDSDKGSGNNDSTTGTLNIRISEGDKPTLTLTGVTVSEGRFDGAANNQTSDDQHATGTLTITADSDPVVDVRLTLSGQVVDGSGKAITHNGETLTWQEVAGSNGHGFQAVTASGTLVLTVTLPSVPGRIEAHTQATLDYQVTVHTNLDHGADDKLNLSLPVKVTDSDGSVITGSTTAVITDAADPVITAIEGVTVKESDLNGGSGQHGGTSPSGTGEVAIGQVTIAAGSDRVVSLQLDVARFNALNTLTSGGKAVTIGADSQPGVYLGKDSAGKLIFKLTLDVSGRYTFELTGNLDHSVQGKDLLDIQLPLQARDSDGDLSAEVIGHVSVQDDVPVAVDASKTLNEGAKVTGDLLATASEGADDAVVRSVTINGTEHPIAASGNTSIAVTDSTGQVIGTLVISAEGNYSFTATSGVNHSNNTLVQTIDFHLVDGDGDTDDGVLTLTIWDEAGKLTVSAVTGAEDAGASDPTHGIPITMALDIGDYDRGEFVEKLLIQAPANAHGTFYFNGVALTTITQGGKTWYEVPPAAMVAVANTDDKFQLTGVTFVPNHDYSSYNNGGAPLRFPVQLQVGVTEGSKPPVLTGNLDITVQGIADKPLWDAGSTHQHYTTDEDSSGIALNVKAGLTDTDGSETLSYQIKWASGQGSLTLNGKVLTPGANGLYTVAGGDINKVTVVPGKDYSGDIKLIVTPVSTEKTPVVTGKETALGDPLEVIVNVNPLADDAKLTVREIQGKEDTLIDLGSKIGLAHLGDTTDGSEQLFVRISGLPAGATLLLGGVAVTLDANGYYEVPYDRINDLKLLPPKNSNVDFDLTIKGVVKDTAILTDASGQTHTVVNEKETGSQSLHVDLVGVVDEPHFDLNTTDWTQDGNGYSITIQEDGRAPLDFKLTSGEWTDTPLDHSETLNLVLEGLPEGAKVFDGSGKELTLTFAGLDGKGNPLYQVDVTSLGNLEIQPPPNSTADLHLVGHVVVTENDGDHKSFDVPLTIKVEPAIDATDYAKTSHGLEDQFTVLDWQPDLTDGAEKVTHLSLSGIEPGYEVWIRVGGVETQLTVSGGAVDLSDAELQSLLGGGQLLVKGPEDSDRDTTLQSHVTVTQVDVDSSATAQKVIDGTLHVDIQAVVEPDGNLVQTGQLESPDGHDIPLDGVFVFEDLDPSSDEVIDYLVISDLPPGFVVVGGINDGKGNWTVPHDALGSYALRSPDGFTGTVTFKVSARVVDLGDNNEGDVSAPAYREITASADFHGATHSGQVAADVDFDNSTPITGVEDHGVNFGSQLKQMVTLGTADIGDDELSIVITGLPPGVNVQGLTYDFVNGEYLIKLPGGLDDLDRLTLTLTLPQDYAGDGLHFNVRLVNTDTVSGDTKMVEKDVTLSITPEVDINGGADGLPELQLNVKDVNGDGQPDNLEDTDIHLDLSVKLADISPSVADGGLETVEQVVVTVDPQYGHFLDKNGQPVSTLTVNNPADLKDLVFVPKEHFSGKVPLAVTVDILDTATTGTVRGSWSGNVSFEVLPVNDPANLTVQNVTGQEDGSVSLGGLGASLIDNDGSEQIVGLQIKGVPDGFTLSAPAVNNGGGVWQVPVGTDFSKLTLIPPADFSGTVDLTLSAFTLDQGLTLPLETSGSFTVTVKPVGDAIIADLQDKASGTEGDVITLNLGLETRDTHATGGNAGNVNENGPEQVRVTLEGVPDGAEIRLPSGVNGTVVDLGGGRWQVITDGGKLDAVELVTNDANGAMAIKVTAQSLDNGALGPEVNGTIHLDVSPVNDAPVNVLPDDPQVAQEDEPFVIQGLHVKDVDAGNGIMEVRLSVEHGTLTLPAGSGVTLTGNGTGDVVLTGTLADLNALLSGGVTYQGDPDFHGNDALTMVTDDRGNTGSGGALSDTDVLPILVQPVNDAPVNQLPTTPQVAQEDQPFTIHGLQVSDVDAGNSPLSVTLSVLHGTLELAAGSGVTVSGSGSNTLVLSGSQDAINALLAGGVTYQGEQDFNGQDALTMVTNDLGNTGSGGPLSDTDVLPIEVEPVNDAPVTQVPGSLQVKEDGSLSLTGISVKDVDAGSAPISMVLRVEHGVLTLLGAAGAVSVQGAGTSVVTLVGSLDDLNGLLAGNLHYEPARDFWGQDNLSITTSDQGNTGAGGVLTDSAQIAIQVTAEPDDPQLGVGTHDILALQGAWVPLNLSASVVNPAPGELSVRIQNLGSAQVVDEHGQSVGHADGNDWLLPMDQSVPIYLKDLPAGDHALTLSAESSLGGGTLSSATETITIHSQSGHDLLGSDQGDWLFGSSGNDRLLGGMGDDVLRGGQGNDILTGGAGSDLFVWGSGDEGTTASPAIDTITDFRPQEGDRIDLADLLKGVTDSSVDGLLGHLQASVTSTGNGLSDVSLSVSPAGDGNVTQQITLKDVDLSGWNLSGSSSHDILQSMLDQHSLIIQHP